MEPLAELPALIERNTGTDGTFETGLPRLRLIRSSAPSEPIHTLYEASFCLVAQGRKKAIIGGVAHVYDPSSFLVVGIDLPVIGAVLEASADAPYLCLQLELDRPALAELLLARNDRAASSAVPAAGVSAATPELIDAATRLARLIEAPDDAPVLAPLIEREILYRLLNGPRGDLLAQIARGDSRLNQIARAVAFIRASFADDFAIHDLAAGVGMSVSTFHEHFRSATSMTPLQFRNRIRLQEARRLMVGEGIGAAEAGFRVGYDSPSQFSRDYARVYRSPPHRDVRTMRTSNRM